MSHIKTAAIILAAFIMAFGSLHAADFTGTIIDSQTGEPVPGVMIKLIGYDNAVLSGTDGQFALSNLPVQEGEIVITQLGYEIEKLYFSADSRQPLQIKLIPKILKGQDIIVTATRAQKGETPAAFSNYSRGDIEQNYWAQDTPILLSSMPNIFAYSDAGNGVGYSYLKIRGFDQKRVAVMLNGVPLNDADSHEVFWVDLPDFTSNVQDIQVQRGAASSLYGLSAIGGSVNLLTNDFAATPELKVETGYGSYETKKLSLLGNSGLINDSYVFYGRFSRIETDGYRDDSWSEMYSYFFGIARYDDNMTLKFNTYGGPEKSHLAYKGITSEQLATDRKYNELEYDGEIDQFNQPHYELLHDWKLSDVLKLENTLYYFNGDGSYTQKRDGKDIEEYFANISGIYVTDTLLADRDYYDLDDEGNFVVNDDGTYTLEQVDLIRKLSVVEDDWGWIPRATISHNKGKLILGGEMRIHSAHHFGEVTWASVYPQVFEPDAKYYDYRGKANTFTVYVYESYQLIEKLNVMLNLQYQRHNYKLEDDERFDVTFDRTYDFFTPRAGIHYQVADNANIYFSASQAARHPAFKDIYDPTDYWSNPYYKPENFLADGSAWAFDGPELDPEKLFDLELGVDYKYSIQDIQLYTELNLYRMQIKDEIIPYAGQIDDNGYPISGNADNTLHQGVELSLQALLGKKLTFDGNVSFNDDHFVDYIEYGYDYDAWESITYDRSNMRIGGFPSMLANYRFSYDFGALELGLGGQYVGKQYIDNGEQYELDSYHILNGDITYNLAKLVGVNSLKLVCRIQNIANTEYEQAAYIEPDDGLPRYMVGAERNYFVSLKTEF